MGTGPAPRRRDWCFVWSGANDYIFEPITSVPSTVVANVSAAIQELADAGCQNHLILNLPNIGETPFAKSVPGLEALLTPKIEDHNEKLADEVDVLREDLGIKIILLDVNTLFARALAGQLGFVNSTVPCLAGLFPTGACPVDDTGQIDRVAPGALFMDGVHPTTAAHRLIAVFAFGALGASQGNQIAAAE